MVTGRISIPVPHYANYSVKVKKKKYSVLAPKLYNPNIGYAFWSAGRGWCWQLQRAFGFCNGFVVVVTQKRE